MSANIKTVRYVDMELDSIHSVEFKNEVCFVATTIIIPIS